VEEDGAVVEAVDPGPDRASVSEADEPLEMARDEERVADVVEEVDHASVPEVDNAFDAVVDHASDSEAVSWQVSSVLGDILELSLPVGDMRDTPDR